MFARFSLAPLPAPNSPPRPYLQRKQRKRTRRPSRADCESNDQVVEIDDRVWKQVRLTWVAACWGSHYNRRKSHMSFIQPISPTNAEIDEESRRVRRLRIVVNLSLSLI